MSAARIRIVARVGVRGVTLSPFVVVSLTVHLLFVTAVWLLPSFRTPAPIPDSFFVDLRGSLPAPPPPEITTSSAPPPARQETPPAPEPEGVHVETREPEKPKPEPEKKPKPEKPKPAPPRPDPTTNTGPPAEGGPVEAPDTQATAASASPGGSSIRSGDATDDEFAWYRASVTAALFSHWQRPVLSGVRESIEVAVAFRIRRDGSVSALRIEQSSGVPSMDRSALRAVSDAAPLPGLPFNWREQELEAHFIFVLHPGDY